MPLGSRKLKMSLGYDHYVQSLGQTLRPPPVAEYGDGSSDDLSSEWETEPDSPQAPGHTPQQKTSGWRKVRSYVRCTPFVQIYKKHKYPWVQLAGHQGNFKPGFIQGTVLKKASKQEGRCLEILMKDELGLYIPDYQGNVMYHEEEYMQLEDLLANFDNPCVMDCKIGVRTYLEDELLKAKENPKLRKDLFDKMIQVDPKAPTEEEHSVKGITKPRYMIWRETISSTALLGFRIEGVRKSDGTSTKDFKLTRNREQVLAAFRHFLEGSDATIPQQYLSRLRDIEQALLKSVFFSNHELIGSSLLFVYDKKKASVWLIDFAKSYPVPEGTRIDHRCPWVLGNHEDGYLIGLSNLIAIFEELCGKTE